MLSKAIAPLLNWPAALAAPALAGLAPAAPALAASALAAPALAAPALASPVLAAPALAAPALAGPAVWAKDEVSAIGLYGCTKLITTVAVGGLHSSWPANRLFVLSSKAWLQDQSAICELLKNPRPN